MVRILIFRTDRVGDLIVTCPVILSLKKYFKNPEITLICSEKNHDYAKKLNFFHEIITFPRLNFIKKIIIINKISKNKFNYVFAFDGKERSILSTAFINSDYKIAISQKKYFYYKIFNIKFFKDDETTNYEQIYQKSLDYCKINTKISNYNFINNKINNFFSKKIPIKNYIHIHLDEKWFSKLYIKSYTDINPDYNNFVNFLELINKKNNILITTGLINFKLIEDLKNKYFIKQNEKIFFKKNTVNSIYFVFMPTYDDLESLLRNTKVLITCHGSITHAANSFNIKKFDILEKKKLNFYKKFNSYLKEHYPIYREDFNTLKNILQKVIEQ